MSHKAKRVADAIASATTRRGFLGTLGRAAGAAAMALAGLAAGSAQAAGNATTTCCMYWCGGDQGYPIFKCTGNGKCPRHWKGCQFADRWEVADCSECRET